MILIKQLFNKLFSYIKRQGTWWMLYFVFTWIVPLILINEKYVFYDRYSSTLRLTAVGVTVAIVLAFAFRKFLWQKTITMQPSVIKWVLLVLHRTVPYLVVVAGCYLILNHTKTILDLLWQIGVSWIIGAIFELVYVVQQKAIQAEQLNAEIDSRIKLTGGANDEPNISA